MIHELGWVLIMVGGPMLAAALWTLYTDPDVAARRRRNAAVRKLRREGRLTRDAARSIKAGEWL